MRRVCWPVGGTSGWTVTRALLNREARELGSGFRLTWRCARRRASAGGEHGSCFLSLLPPGSGKGERFLEGSERWTNQLRGVSFVSWVTEDVITGGSVPSDSCAWALPGVPFAAQMPAMRITVAVIVGVVAPLVGGEKGVPARGDSVVDGYDDRTVQRPTDATRRALEDGAVPGPPPPSSSEWRITNGATIGDHWIISEVEFYADRECSVLLEPISIAVSSMDYGVACGGSGTMAADGTVECPLFNDGTCDTSPHCCNAGGSQWAGGDGAADQAPEGTWVAYRFAEPTTVGCVQMCHSEASHQQMTTVLLQYTGDAGMNWGTYDVLEFEVGGDTTASVGPAPPSVPSPPPPSPPSPECFTETYGSYTVLASSSGTVAGVAPLGDTCTNHEGLSLITSLFSCNSAHQAVCSTGGVPCGGAPMSISNNYPPKPPGCFHNSNVGNAFNPKYNPDLASTEGVTAAFSMICAGCITTPTPSPSVRNRSQPLGRLPICAASPQLMHYPPACISHSAALRS